MNELESDGVSKMTRVKYSPCNFSNANLTVTKAGTVQSNKSNLRSNTGELETSLIASVMPADTVFSPR